MVGIEVDLSGSQRGVQDVTLKTGRVWYNPYSTTILEYPTYMQNVVWSSTNTEGNEAFVFNTKGSMSMELDVNLSYQLMEKKIPEFYIKFRNDDLTAFTFGYLHNTARDCFTETGGHYTIDEIMSDNAPFLKDVRHCFESRVEPLGVQVSQFGIRGAPRPPPQITQSINAKMQAEQIALQKQTEVLQAEADAKKAVAEAQGEANSNVERAKGEAAANIASAKGEAEANRIKSSSIDDRLIKWYSLSNQKQMIEKWDGQVPYVQGSAGGLLLQLPAKEQKQ